jgi:dUTP pyrophosphatase
MGITRPEILLELAGMEIPVKILKTHPDAVIPEYKTPGACGFDFTIIENRTVEPGEIVRLRTGLIFCVPIGHVLLIAARSSLAKKFGLIVPQGTAIIDQDFCGPEDELLMQVQNTRATPVEVKKGDRLLQGLVVPFSRVAFDAVSGLSGPSRGGFGTTG